MAAYRIGSNSNEIGDLGSKAKVSVTQYLFFVHNSLLNSLICISAFLCPIEMKFDMSLRYALGRFVFEFHTIGIDDDIIVTLFTFSPNNCPSQILLNI